MKTNISSKSVTSADSQLAVAVLWVGTAAGLRVHLESAGAKTPFHCYSANKRGNTETKTKTKLTLQIKLADDDIQVVTVC
jgi:hypothetical protein